VQYGDVTFLLDEQYVSFLGPEAYDKLLTAARTELAPNFADLISDIAEECDEDDPEGYFENNSQALGALEELFSGDEEISSHVQMAYGVIEEKLSEIKEKPTEASESDGFWDGDQYSGANYQATSSSDIVNASNESPSVFDDIDT
jgi:hypothetical protein